MKASNLKNQSARPNKPIQPNNTTNLPETKNLMHVPSTPFSDQAVKDLVKKAFPTPSIAPSLIDSILKKINKRP